MQMILKLIFIIVIEQTMIRLWMLFIYQQFNFIFFMITNNNTFSQNLKYLTCLKPDAKNTWNYI